MIRTFRMQMAKVFHRADVITCIAVFFLIPLLIAFLISIRSGIIQIGDSVFSAFGYASVIIGLLKSLFLLGGIIVLITTSVVSREIDTRLDCTFFTKLGKQEHLFISKNMAVDCAIFCIFASLIVSSLLGWLIILRDTEFGSTVILAEDRDEGRQLIFSIVSAFLEMIAAEKIAAFISLLMKYSRAVIVNLVIIIGIRILANIETIRRWNPSFIGDGTGLFEFTGDKLMERGFEGVAVLLIYAAVFAAAGTIAYRKMDLVR
ncbi:MAG: hypothetical protein ACOX6J_06505 [Oscillospiraceae bacterium]|jgi:hypothetical protein